MLQLPHIFGYIMRYRDELVEGEGGTGGAVSEADLTVDIDKASDAIGADLGLGKDEGGTEDLTDGSATPPKEKEPVAPNAAAKLAREKAVAATAKLADAKKLLTEKKVDFTGKTDADVLKLAEEAGKPVGRNLPKSWKKEMEAIWKTLPVESQAYIEQRELETETGFKANAEHVNYGKSVRELFQPYEALLTSQGAKDHGVVMKTLLNSHYILSTGTPEAKAEFTARLARNYGIDLAKATEAFTKGGPQETASEKALRERVDKMESERRTSAVEQFDNLKKSSAAEVAAFSADPKHPYFNEVAEDVVLLLANPNLTLEQAYERAVYANPVTRAKELARLSKEAEDKARTAAEEKAKLAEKARGLRVKGTERERESPDLLGTMEQTMRATMKDINSRQDS